MSKKKKAAKSKGARGVRNLPAKTLSAKDARGVKGGRKAGKLQHEFMIVKLNDVIITGVT
jgi:hypothetical protein